MTRFQRLPTFSLICAFTFALGCGPSAEEPVQIMESSAAVINTFNIVGEEPAGMSTGFNLDGYVSDGHDGRSCYQEDFTSKSGELGIDNALAQLLPLIDIAGEGALQGLLQQAVNEGRLLLLMKLDHRSDGNYNLTLLRGDDIPMLGTDGLLLEGQTLALHAEPQLGYFENAIASDNVVLAGPMQMHLPVVVFNILYEMDLEDAWIEFEITEEGMLKNGRLGGSVTLDQVMGLVMRAAQRTHGLEELLAGGIQDAADLNRNASGKCESLSMAVTFGAVPAFTF